MYLTFSNKKEHSDKNHKVSNKEDLPLRLKQNHYWINPTG